MEHTPDPAAAPDGGGRHEQSRRDVEVRVRRSPKYGVFMALGALIGAILTWAVSVAVTPGLNEAGERVDTSPVVGLMIVVGFVAGAALGALVAVLIDRSLAKRTRSATAEQVDFVEADASADAGAQGTIEGAFEHLEQPGGTEQPGATERRRAAEQPGARAWGDGTSPEERDTPRGV